MLNNRSKDIFTMAKRISKIDSSNVMESLNLMTKNPIHINYGREKIMIEKLERILKEGQKVTITKTGEYPARLVRGKEADEMVFVKIGDRGQIHKKDSKGSWIWLDKELETLVWIPNNEYR